MRCLRFQLIIDVVWYAYEVACKTLLNKEYNESETDAWGGFKLFCININVCSWKKKLLVSAPVEIV